ncbi:SDR family NAD(P)-dependent oxidoreductase [uncultured Eubacterium sp.]|uniref:SDR family NAD(P)-dependent oxidoreductase n=1 Tax=uncultured Eubacterium sp. TaxID=165185 RepID=UPI0026DB0D18|nr:SDR family oxidoreductase [uncultured Eubacterium sp.]
MRSKEIIKKIFKRLTRQKVVPEYIPVVMGELLENRTILITGGIGGIGVELTKACLRNGASVVITSRNEKKLKECLPELNKCKNSEKQKIICVELDINNVDSMKNIFNKIVKDNSLKNIDTLINNAGVAIGGIIGTTKEEEFDKTITTNLKGTYFLSQEFANYLIKENIQGNILNISSVSGIRPAITPYMLSKHSLIGLTEGLAKKLIKYGIVVNGIAPGPTVTDMIGVKGNDLYYQNSPAQRYVDPVEVANLAVYLISKMGKMIVGDTVYISGGCGNLTRDDIMY